jgi:hypothetical protein
MAVKCSADELKDADLFIDLGSGTGSASKLMMSRCRTKRVLANDFSEASGAHLRSHLGAVAARYGTELNVVTGDCRAISYEPGCTVLAISVVFGLQPSLLAAKGGRIKAALGREGILLAASSMVGMSFYQALIDGSDPRLARWPWYSTDNSLAALFSDVRRVRVGSLVVTLASDSSSRLDGISARMLAAGGRLAT